MANAQSRFGNPANYNSTPATRNDGDYSALEVDASGNLRVNQVGGTAAPMTSSGLLINGPGQMSGYFVNSTSGGTIRFSDALTATDPYLGAAFTPTAGVYYPFPATFKTGAYVTIGGTMDATIFVIRGENQAILPSLSPSISPSYSPSKSPSISPSKSPSISPSASPSTSISPSISPSASSSASISPSKSPSISPSVSPSYSSSSSPSLSPSLSPSISPSYSQSISPSSSPSVSPSFFE